MASSHTVLSPLFRQGLDGSFLRLLSKGKRLVCSAGGARGRAEDSADTPTRKFPKVLAPWLLEPEINSRSLGPMCGRVKQEGDKHDKNSSHTVVPHVRNRKRTWKQGPSWFHPRAFIKGTRRFSLGGYFIFSFVRIFF